MRRLVPSLLTVVLVCASCSLLTDGSDLADALDALPADATRVVFVDRAATAARLGLDGPEGADTDTYLERTRTDAVGGTPLLGHLTQMAGGAAFDERDVEWSATAELSDGSVTVYRVADDVDLSSLGDLGGAAYPPELAGATIDADRHLLVVGSSASAVLETLAGDRDSLTDADTFDTVLAGVDDVDDIEYAVLDADPTCLDTILPLLSRTDAGVTELDRVGPPEVTSYVVTGAGADTGTDSGTDESAALEFGDDTTAGRDAAARAAYLDDGLLLGTGQPVASVLSADVVRDGTVVRVSLDLTDPAQGRGLAATGDGFGYCFDPSAPPPTE